MKTIVLGGGCFWCIEAVYLQIRGIAKVVSGYAGGTLPNPDYEHIGDHAEVVELTYDETKITLEQILDIFFHVHNPTTLNRQGNDTGTQYRSIILYNDEGELEIAKRVLEENRKTWDDPIVTELQPLTVFYPAESYHQNYFNKNPDAAYCQVIINPKLVKFRQEFTSYLKDAQIKLTQVVKLV